MKKYLVCCIAVLLCLCSCHKEVESVSLSNKEIELTMGETEVYQLKAVVSPKRAAKELVWETNRKNVATVSENGTVQAQGTGYCIITAKAGDKSDACKVWVYDGSSALQALELNKDTAIMYEGQHQQLVCSPRPSFVSVKVAWTSTDTNILKVSATGVVTACRAGSAGVVATAGNKKAQCTITVKKVGMTLDRAKDTMVVSEKRQLKLTLTPAISVSDQVKWTSSNTNVVTVSATGMVTAVGAGKAVVKAGIGTSEVQCEYEVKNAILTMQSVIAIYECRSYALNYTIRPAEAASAIKWTSDSDSVTVANGVCTLKHYPSKAVITATYKDVTAQCTVSVACTKVTVSETQVSIRKDQTYQLYKTTTPAGDSTKVTWSTSNSSIAKVSSSGLVTAVSAGTAYITATLHGCRTSVCTVSVRAADITLNKDSLYLLIGSYDTLTANVVPSSSAGSLSWSSSNTAIATVNAAGVVTGKAAGTTVIKAVVGNTVKACTVVVTAGTYYTCDGHVVYKNGNAYFNLPGFCKFPKIIGSNIYSAVLTGSTNNYTIKLYKNSTVLATSGTIRDMHNNSVEAISVCNDGTIYVAAIVKDQSSSEYKYRVYKYTGGSGFSTTDYGSNSSYGSLGSMYMEGSSSSQVYTYVTYLNKLYVNNSGTSVQGIACAAKAEGGTDVYMAGGNTSGQLLWYKNGSAVANHGMGTTPLSKIYITSGGDKYGVSKNGGQLIKNGTVIGSNMSAAIYDSFTVNNGNYYHTKYGVLYKNGKKIFVSRVLSDCYVLVVE